MLSWLSRRKSSVATSAEESDFESVSFNDPIGRALADRERESVLQEARSIHVERTRSPGAPDGAMLAQRVSGDAYQLIVRHETGGPEYYKNKYKEAPVWPQEASGITIGFGYDLGYQANVETFKADWAGVLPDDHLRLLADGVGLHYASGVDRDGRGREERVALIRRQLKVLKEADVKITWQQGDEVFRRVSLPNFAVLTYDALPNCDGLTPDCFGALVSLTFNRGPSYAKAGERYEEMRSIKEALANHRPRDVPSLVRKMKRIWKGQVIQSEMDRRRENEARLFEQGLVALVAVAPNPGSTSLESVNRPAEGRQLSGVVASKVVDEDAFTRGDLESPRTREFSTEVLEAASGVGWIDDDHSPDYAHLGNKLSVGMKFSLRADDLEFLARLNDFPIADALDTPILFGLRGCGIRDAGDLLQDEVQLTDQRPNHRVARCVMGVWERGRKKIAVFPASTVPYADAVQGWFDDQDAGNLLPTGFYGYIVGDHNGRPGCFLLRKSANEKRTVAVRRSSNDLMYDRTDVVDICKPGDNIHPSFGMGTDWFSSVGCARWLLARRTDPAITAGLGPIFAGLPVSRRDQVSPARPIATCC